MRIRIKVAPSGGVFLESMCQALVGCAVTCLGQEACGVGELGSQIGGYKVRAEDLIAALPDWEERARNYWKAMLEPRSIFVFPHDACEVLSD